MLPSALSFEGLKKIGWGNVHARVGRPFASVADTFSRTMTLGDHHEWVPAAASDLTLDSDTLWQAVTAEWATKCLDAESAVLVVAPISDLLSGIVPEPPAVLSARVTAATIPPPPPVPVSGPNAPAPHPSLFENAPQT